MSEIAGSKANIAVFQLQRDRLFADAGVDQIAIAQGHEQIVIIMPMDQCGCLGCNYHVEYAQVLILEDLMMTWFGCDLNGLLLGQSGRGQKQQSHDTGRSHIKIVKISAWTRK